MGASVRAAAWSALRAGWLEPTAIDLFGDEDLRRMCPTRTIPPPAYPRGFIDAARSAPRGPWIYTGALENYPQVVEAISRERPLWGNPPESLRRVRDPLELGHAVRKIDLVCPSLSLKPPLDDDSRSWLVKPFASAGGVGIRAWKPGDRQQDPTKVYYQRRIDGDAMAAAYLSSTDGECNFLGLTRQLVGRSWLHAKEFQYCGSVGPLLISQGILTVLQSLGDLLTRDFSLRGVFGVDLIFRIGDVYPLEVNPRYTASMEILERALGYSIVGLHARGIDPSLPSLTRQPVMRGVHGKAIYFAPRSLIFPEKGPWKGSAFYADVPTPGTKIAAGSPVLTFFANSDSEDGCEKILQETAQTLDRRLSGC